MKVVRRAHSCTPGFSTSGLSTLRTAVPLQSDSRRARAVIQALSYRSAHATSTPPPSRRTKHHRPVNSGLAAGIGGVGGAEVGEQGVHEVGAVAGAGEPALHGAVG